MKVKALNYRGHPTEEIVEAHVIEFELPDKQRVQVRTEEQNLEVRSVTGHLVVIPIAANTLHVQSSKF